VDENGKLVGVVSLREMATAPANTLLMDLAKKDVVAVTPTTSNEEVSQLVERYNFLAIPVVDNDKILGVITIDDVVDIIQEQATADIYASAGLQEDDRVYSPILFSIKNRLPWMLLNLILASYVSRVVSMFETTMQELIVLATLNNIVAGMGGNTAIQTLTVVTRGLSVGDFNYTSKKKAVLKEAAVGSFNGVIVGLCAGILVYFWKDNLMVSIVICLALILNSFMASTLGTIVPLTLKHFKRDPAAGSGVIVTVLCDCLGIFLLLRVSRVTA
jgi:magnesium transporter